MSRIKKAFTFFFFVIFTFFSVVPSARAWCFMLPDSITYGSSTDALTAGIADSAKVDPDVSDVMYGRVLMANLYSIDSFDIILSDANPADSKTIHMLKGQAFGVRNDLVKYFVIDTSPIAQGTTLDPDTDVWAKGNWPYWYPNMISETRNGELGGYIRLTPFVMQTLPFAPTKIRVTNIVRLAVENYVHTQDVPNGAAEAPFSTGLFVDSPTIEVCYTDYCDNPNNGTPVYATWTLKKKVTP